MSGLVLLCAACGSRSSAGPADAHGKTVENGVSNASCVAPYLNDQPSTGPFHAPTPTVSPGATLTVHGHWYTSTCNDTGGHDQLQPLPPVHLTVAWPNGETQRLGELVPGGDDMGFSIKVRVPPAAGVGMATVRDDQQHPATFRFAVGR